MEDGVPRNSGVSLKPCDAGRVRWGRAIAVMDWAVGVPNSGLRARPTARTAQAANAAFGRHPFGTFDVPSLAARVGGTSHVAGVSRELGRASATFCSYRVAGTRTHARVAAVPAQRPKRHDIRPGQPSSE